MLGHQIFRKTSLEKMTTPEDLDELLQVNSVKTWLIFTGICAILAGMLTWGFLGSISQNVQGFGIIKTQGLWREALADCSGQIDSVFCNVGDEVDAGQKLVRIFELEKKVSVTVNAMERGKIVALNVREGTFVTMGTPLLELMRYEKQKKQNAVVIFYIVENDILKLKKGMICDLNINKKGIPPEFLSAVITFISDYSVSKSTISKYFPGEEMADNLSDRDFHEVRATLFVDTKNFPTLAKFDLKKLNWLSCNVIIPIDQRSPIAFLFK